MNRRDRIEARLNEALEPMKLEIEDESHRHAGHSGARPGGETHYRLHIVSERFVGKSRLARHRLVYDALGDEIAGGLHAIALQTFAPGEG